MTHATILVANQTIKVDLVGPGGAIATAAAADADTSAEASATSAAESAASAVASAASAAEALVSEGSAGTYLDGVLAAVAGLPLDPTLPLQAVSRTILAGFTGMSAGRQAMLSEAGREGLFVWSTADLSSEVTADTLQGMYVAPMSDTTGASGAWVRRVTGPVMLNWFGAPYATADGVNDTLAVKLAGAAAAVTTNAVWAGPGTHRYSAEMDLPTGVALHGTPETIFKAIDQVSTTTTGAITSGTGEKTFTVTDITGFAVGQGVMLATGATVSPNDPYSHYTRTIKTITPGAGVTGTIVLNTGPNVQAHASGAIIATTCHGVIMKGDNLVEGITFDGNEANNLYAHWVTTVPLVQDGNNCTRRRVTIQNTPSDAFLAGGPSGGEIVGCYGEGCRYLNIGGNGPHLGNISNIWEDKPYAVDGNMRWTDPVEQGGGASARLGHQDGFFTASNDVRKAVMSYGYIENFACGWGAWGNLGAVYGEEAHSIGNVFVDCASPYEMTGNATHFHIVGDRCKATYPFPRWTNHKLSFPGDSTSLEASKITIKGLTVENGYIEMIYVSDVDLDVLIDNSASMDEWLSGGVFLNTFRNVRGNITVIGGLVGLGLQTNTAGWSAGSHIHVQLLDQKSRGLNSALVGSGTLPMIITGSARGTSGISNSTWIGFAHSTGLKIQGASVDHDLGGTATPFSGGVAGTDRKNCIINGTYE